MTIQQAIEKAIDGGYSCPVNIEYFTLTKAGKDEQPRIFLDPLFWQSLGTAMGWENESECPLACCGGICPIDIPMWKSQWHLFIDKLANGGTAEQFFEEL